MREILEDVVRSVGRVEALMFASEDGRDLQVGEGERVPKEPWDPQAQVENKELWDHKV